jgi:hypothetical protein
VRTARVGNRAGIRRACELRGASVRDFEWEGGRIGPIGVAWLAWIYGGRFVRWQWPRRVQVGGYACVEWQKSYVFGRNALQIAFFTS